EVLFDDFAVAQQQSPGIEAESVGVERFDAHHLQATTGVGGVEALAGSAPYIHPNAGTGMYFIQRNELLELFFEGMEALRILDAQLLQAVLQALIMPLRPKRLPIHNPNALEHPIAVQKPPVDVDFALCGGG